MKDTLHRSCGLLAAFLFALCFGLSAYADEKPVKVYILSGQSNMVGIGQANPSGMTRYNTYVAKDTKKENQGCVVSVYAGAYDPAVDYDKAEAVETHQVRVGYWPHASAPAIEGEQTHVARGYIKIDKPGRYGFKSTSGGSLLEVNGKVMFNSMPDQEPVEEVVKFDKGIYPIKITFNGVARTNLTYQFLDVPGSLHTVVKEQGKYPELLGEDGQWASRDDVWYKGVVTAAANQWLSVGCGAGNGKVGPELGFGFVMGDYHDEPVLILKASQGNRSLAWDFLPPGSERFEMMAKTKTGEEELHVFAGYKDPKPFWLADEAVPEPGGWYAGKQYDDCFNAAKDVLANFDKNFPMWEGRGYEIAGFVWWQGHKDSGHPVHRLMYQKNLSQLIKTLRSEFKAPKAPFVVGTVGFGGFEGMNDNFKEIAEAQLAVDSSKSPFQSNVKSVETRGFWKSAEESPKSQDFHYHQNGEVYYNVGTAFGKGMIELLEAE